MQKLYKTHKESFTCQKPRIIYIKKTFLISLYPFSSQEQQHSFFYLCIFISDDVHADVAVVLLERVDDVEEEERLARVDGGKDHGRTLVVKVEVNLEKLFLCEYVVFT